MAGTPIATPQELGIDWAEMRRVLCRESLIAYIQTVAPWFVVEEVHCVIAEHLEAVARREIDRLMLFMPPRTGKSQMASIFFPSWYTGKFPSEKILQIGHSTMLSRGFSLDIKELMALPDYRWIFPGVQMSKAARATGRWKIEEVSDLNIPVYMQRTKLGEYRAAGTTTGIAGTGFNLGILDDAMSEQDKDSKIVKDRLWAWYGPGFYTRRQPEKNAIVLAATRWAKDDLPGHLIDLGERVKGADRWTTVNVPAILDKENARKIYLIAKEYGAIENPTPMKEGDSFSPKRWPMKELMRSKAANTERDWNALYMGQPTDIEGVVLKKRHWRLWPKKDPPTCTMVFQMYDTAFDEKTANDMSARSTWGLFQHREREGERASTHMILLEAWEQRVEAPELKKHVLIGAWGGKEAKKALLEMNPQDPEMVADIDVTEVGMLPDRIMIEAKASGIWLVKELRRIRKPRPLPVHPYNGPRGGRGQEMGKYGRAQRASLVLEQGAVWYMDRRWAEKVINQISELRFDGTDASDDLGDTVTAAMNWVRDTYRVELGSDVDEDAEARAKVRSAPRQFYGTRRR